MIFDTDVMIWYFRGNVSAKKILDTSTDFCLSAVTVMELLQGSRNKEEMRLINKFLHQNNIPIHYINHEITQHAIHLLETYTLSDGIEWGDALIAATALYYGEPLLTANIKHYRFISGLLTTTFKPRV